MDLVWTCPCCSKQYDTLSFAYALDEPDLWRETTERGPSAVLGTDTCVIGGQRFFVRGRIVIPVIGSTDPFIWGTWAEVPKASFERFGQLWDVELREHEPPFAGRLGSDIPVYPTTLNLECRILMKNARKRPSFVLEPADHPLVAEQRNGITLERVKEIASVVQRHSR